MPARALLLLLIPALVAAQTVAPGAAPALRPGAVLDRIAAEVGNEIILQSDVDGKALFSRMQFPQLSDSVARAQALQALVDEKLLYARAVEDSVQVSDDEVTQELDYQMQQFIQQYGSAERVEQVYGKSIAQLKRDYRELVRKRQMGSRWLQQKFGNVPRVTREDVEEFFRTYHDTLVKQTIPEAYDIAELAIAVRPSAAARDSALQRARALLDSLQHGAPFADLARRYSQDPSSAANGGDLGFQKRGIFVKPFEQVAFSLKEGQISGVVETEFGFHIIQMLERRGEDVHARHILIRVPRTGADERTAIDSLRALRARILAGASFEDLARAYSDDPDTRPLGGQLGPQPLTAVPAALRDSIAALRPGEISQPLAMRITSALDGYALIRLARVIPAHPPALETDYKQLERLTGQYLQQKEYDRVLADLRAHVYWKVYP